MHSSVSHFLNLLPTVSGLLQLCLHITIYLHYNCMGVMRNFHMKMVNCEVVGDVHTVA